MKQHGVPGRRAREGGGRTRDRAIGTPVGSSPTPTVQFVRAYADNLNWGMEAAPRSARRVALAIDQA
jgi:hypothetical protein